MPYFVKFSGLDGDSNDPRHPNWTEVRSWSWGGANKPRYENGMAPSFAAARNVSVSMVLDRSRYVIQQAATEGQVFPEVTIEANTPSMRVHMKDVMVSNFRFKPSPAGGQPLCTFDLNGENVEFHRG